jgi:hypothetical protein
MPVGGRRLGLACALALSGCYGGAQRTSQMTVTADVDPVDGMPASDLSFSADFYEVTGGALYKGIDVFAGAGFGPQKVHQRTRDTATATSEVSLGRVHFGVAYELATPGGFAVRVFGVLASDLNSFYFGSSEVDPADPSLIDSRVKSSRELGLQLSPVARRSTRRAWFVEPVIRIAIASQSGEVQPMGYTNGDGTTAFDATALLVTFGVNAGIGKIF